MGGTDRLPFVKARQLAWLLLRELECVCDRIEIAGSIRRQKADIGDIELVVIPSFAPGPVSSDLFGEARPGAPLNMLDERCAELLAAGTLGYRLNKDGKRAWGSQLKWGTYWPKGTDPTLEGFAADIYTASLDTWAVTMLIRTGPSEFSHRLVTPRSQGGYCPSELEFKDWRLRRRDTHAVIDTPTEEDLFEAMDLLYLPPEVRSDQWLPRLSRAR